MTFSSEHDEQQELPDPIQVMEDDAVDVVQEQPTMTASTDSEPIVRPSSAAVDDMTLAEAFGELLRNPARTLRALGQVVSSADEKPKRVVMEVPTPSQSTSRPLRPKATSISNQDRVARQRDVFMLSIRFVAFMVAVYGNWLMATERSEEIGLAGGLPFLLAAFVIWIAGDVFVAWPLRRARTQTTVEEFDIGPVVGGFDGWISNISFLSLALRFLGVALALTMSFITLSATSNNRFTLLGVVTWAVSIALWVMVFAPKHWGVIPLIDGIRGMRRPTGWTLVVLLGIMVVAMLFRFTDLSSIPSEMTSDHVEKILDSQSILNGEPQVFFPNNGGREPIQFYLMALISHIPGLGLNFFTLKFLTAVEGMLCIPVLWWMGREIIGEDDRELGNVVGLLLAALVAVSYWHTMLSRLGLRIVLTVIVTGLLMVFLSRGMRRNQRGDFIKAGLVLGFGVYAYQAVRMLPVVVIAGVVLAIMFSLFRAGRRVQIARYLMHLAVLVVITLAVFVPMAGFARDYPEDFWRRTSGRLLGDDTIQVTNPDGQIVTRTASMDERMEALKQNVSILVNNIRNALLMYNWKGDVAWITAVPNRPEMDVVTGSLLIVGIGAWLVRMVKRRDSVDWLVPTALFIMLLPSALSIAYPIENPSATRTSGSLPEAYLIAALPLAMVWVTVRRHFPNVWGKVVSSVFISVILLITARANWNMYFVDFNESYTRSSPAPYTEAGRFLRGFADSGGSLGNAFMIAYPYWWDHRAVGIEAGVTDWPNGIVTRDAVPGFIKDTAARGDKYQLNPDIDLLFFYNPLDIDTEAQLKVWFPQGTKQIIPSYKPGDDFGVYRVPKLGAQGLLGFEKLTGVLK